VRDDQKDDGVKERLKEAAQVAKDNANAKAPKPDPPSAVVGKGSAAQGAGVRDESGIMGRKAYGSDKQAVFDDEAKIARDVETELNSILKKSPGKLALIYPTALKGSDEANEHSYRVFEIILSPLGKGEEHLGEIRYLSSAIHRRARSTSPWTKNSSSPHRTYWKKNSTECTS